MADKKSDPKKSGLDRLAEVEKQIARKDERSDKGSGGPNPPRGGMNP